MNWLFVTDHGGFGDIIATAVALGAFRGKGFGICYNTRLWDDPSLIRCMIPAWDYLSPANPHSHPTDDPSAIQIYHHANKVNFTPLNPRGLGFYSGRIAEIERATGVAAGPVPHEVFSRAKVPVWRPPSRYVVIHGDSAQSAKRFSEQEVAFARRAVVESGLDPVVVPIRDMTLAQTVSLVDGAAACICSDSCVSHISHWIGRPTMLINNDRNADSMFSFSGLDRRPLTLSGFPTSEELKAFLNESK